LPVWHNITRNDVAKFSLLLSDRLAADTKNGLDSVAEDIIKAVSASSVNTENPKKKKQSLIEIAKEGAGNRGPQKKVAKYLATGSLLILPIISIAYLNIPRPEIIPPIHGIAKKTPFKLDMGAVVTSEGVTFQVWAPYADEVFIVGDFNNWEEEKNPLKERFDKPGYWSTKLADANIGDNYQYRIVNNNEAYYRRDPYGKRTVGMNSVVVGDTYKWSSQAPVLRTTEMIMYEMHISTFNRTNTKNVGTFLSASDRLDYLRDLGVNVIQLIPVAEFSGDLSWGYNPSFIFSPESSYGTPSDLKDFVDKAHKFGMLVSLDVVFNHLGPGDLDLYRFDGWSQSGNGPGIYFDENRVTPWGLRLNFTDINVRKYLQDSIFYWVSEYGINGLRWDGTDWIAKTGSGPSDETIPHGWSFLQDTNSRLGKDFPNVLRIAENYTIRRYTLKEVREEGAGFDLIWDDEYRRVINDIVINGNVEDLTSLGSVLSKRIGKSFFDRVIYIDNHDTAGRSNIQNSMSKPTSIAGDATMENIQRYTLATALLFTSPGVPLFLQGQEFYSYKPFSDTHPLNWSEKEKHKAILDLYKNLIQIRKKNSKALKSENIDVYNIDNKNNVLAFHRYSQDSDIIVIANLSEKELLNQEIGMPKSGRWKLIFNSDYENHSSVPERIAEDILGKICFRDGMPYSAKVTIGPLTLLIYEKEA
jgi:1,4-alpha-glucan branching enzyme